MVSKLHPARESMEALQGHGADVYYQRSSTSATPKTQKQIP